MNETKLKRERRTKNLNQTTVGYLSGLTQGEVSQIENRRLVPSRNQIERLAKVFNLTPEELLNEVD